MKGTLPEEGSPSLHFPEDLSLPTFSSSNSKAWLLVFKKTACLHIVIWVSFLKKPDWLYLKCIWI